MGLGWKTWTRQRLTAAEMQGYVQDQVVAYFPSNATRDAVLGTTAVPEGLHCYVAETDRTLARVGVGVAGAWHIVSPMPGRQVVKAATQSPAAGAWVALTWDVAAAPGLAGAGMQAGATPTRLFATATGRWDAFVGCNGVTQLQIRKNSAGSDSGGTWVGGGAIASAPVYGDAHVRELVLANGDYLEAFAMRATAGTVGTFSGFGAVFSMSYKGRI